MVLNNDQTSLPPVDRLGHCDIGFPCWHNPSVCANAARGEDDPRLRTESTSGRGQQNRGMQRTYPTGQRPLPELVVDPSLNNTVHPLAAAIDRTSGNDDHGSNVPSGSSDPAEQDSSVKAPTGRHTSGRRASGHRTSGCHTSERRTSERRTPGRRNGGRLVKAPENSAGSIDDESSMSAPAIGRAAGNRNGGGDCYVPDNSFNIANHGLSMPALTAGRPLGYRNGGRDFDVADDSFGPAPHGFSGPYITGVAYPGLTPSSNDVVPVTRDGAATAPGDLSVMASFERAIASSSGTVVPTTAGGAAAMPSGAGVGMDNQADGDNYDEDLPDAKDVPPAKPIGGKYVGPGSRKHFRKAQHAVRPHLDPTSEYAK